MIHWIMIALLAAAADPVHARPEKERAGLPLLFHEDFSDADAALRRFTFADPAAWKIERDALDDKPRAVLSQFKQSDYKPPVRSPVNQAWINDLAVGPCVVEIRARSTAKPNPRRDVCVFLGGQDDRRFLYAHLSEAADASHHQIHLVNNADRAPITADRDAGVRWGDDYHLITLQRDAQGKITVAFDGKTVLSAQSRELPEGRIGFGTLDDTARFASITVWAKAVEPRK